MIRGNASQDLLVSGEGNDKIEGGIGHDTISADAGKDSLYGEAGSDILIGGNDPDEDDLNGGSSPKGSRDTINGQIGFDGIIDKQNEIDAAFTFDFDRLIQTT